jgi:hypothetical protein
MIPPLIRVVLHGGLGNQLFQFFKASLLADEGISQQIVLHTDVLTNYSTTRGLELQPFLVRQGLSPLIVAPIGAVCRLRIPKMINFIIGREPIIGFSIGSRIVDGYFQSARQYKNHNPGIIQSILVDWRSFLLSNNYIQQPRYSELIHIRLGDFCKSREEMVKYATSQLKIVSYGSTVISDEESVIQESISMINRGKELHVLNTSNMNSWEVLNAMSCFNQIISNGSTLAFWAATLSQSLFQTSNIEHLKLFQKFNPSSMHKNKNSNNK